MHSLPAHLYLYIWRETMCHAQFTRTSVLVHLKRNDGSCTDYPQICTCIHPKRNDVSCTVYPQICTCTSEEKCTVYPQICTCTSEEKRCVMHCLPAHCTYTAEEKRCVMHCLPVHLYLYSWRETMCHALFTRTFVPVQLKRNDVSCTVYPHICTCTSD